MSTALEILAKIQATDRIWRSQLVDVRIPPGVFTISDEWTSLKVKSQQDVHNDNYFFGSALQHCKHGDAKRYHEMGQRNKTAYRDQFIRRFNSPHPHKGKNLEVIKTFHALNVAASLGD
mgnify:CR=1 FL=1